MKIQPKYTLIGYEHTIFPIDAWSRKHIRNLCDNLSITYDEVYTTMGAPALKFNEKNYKNIINILKDYTVND